jgi:hypothetical protein
MADGSNESPWNAARLASLDRLRLDGGLSASARVVGFEIGNLADFERDGETCPSQKDLVAALHISTKTAKRAVSALKARGWYAIERRPVLNGWKNFYLPGRLFDAQAISPARAQAHAQAQADGTREFYAAAGSVQLAAWDYYSQNKHGHAHPRDQHGGAWVAAEWPPSDLRSAAISRAGAPETVVIGTGAGQFRYGRVQPLPLNCVWIGKVLYVRAHVNGRPRIKSLKTSDVEQAGPAAAAILQEWIADEYFGGVGRPGPRAVPHETEADDTLPKGCFREKRGDFIWFAMVIRCIKHRCSLRTHDPAIARERAEYVRRQWLAEFGPQKPLGRPRRERPVIKKHIPKLLRIELALVERQVSAALIRRHRTMPLEWRRQAARNAAANLIRQVRTQYRETGKRELLDDVRDHLERGTLVQIINVLADGPACRRAACERRRA